MEKNFATYEYMSRRVKMGDQSRVTDLYEAFGWELTETSASAEGAALSFKRDRKIPHKPELDRLQRKAEETKANLDRLERSKKSGASVFSLVFGCLAALVLGGGMSLVMTVENKPARPDLRHFFGDRGRGAVRGQLSHLPPQGGQKDGRTHPGHRRAGGKAGQSAGAGQRSAGRAGTVRSAQKVRMEIFPSSLSS